MKTGGKSFGRQESPISQMNQFTWVTSTTLPNLIAIARRPTVDQLLFSSNTFSLVSPLPCLTNQNQRSPFLPCLTIDHDREQFLVLV